MTNKLDLRPPLHQASATVLRKLYNDASYPVLIENKGVFPKWSRTFAEFSEFRETDKSPKHELGSI